MNQPSTVPEFIVQESEKIRPMGKLRDFSIRDYQELEVDLVQLSQVLSMHIDTSERTLVLLRALVQSLEEHL